MNCVQMIGRLTRDPESRTTNTGKDVASFSIAVAKRFKKGGDEPDADFFRCTTWEQSARYLCDYGYKGARVSVIGRLETRKYTANDGTEREITEIQVEQVSILDRRDDSGGESRQAAPAASGGRATGGGQRASAPSADEYDPFADN